MSVPTAQRTPFLFNGKTLYAIDGEPGRLFVQQTYGEVEANVSTLTRWRRFRFTRCLAAEAELRRMGWSASGGGSPAASA